MAGIFISYRREDSSGQSGRLYDRLCERFGHDRVFRDVNTIEPGENFLDAVRSRVGSASVTLVVIGKLWLAVKDEQGRPRLANPSDLVLLETAIALEKKISVIPVLVDGAAMPKPEELPESIRNLAWMNALSLSEDTFDYEFGLLCQRIEKVMERQSPLRVLFRRKWQLALVALCLAAGVGFYAVRAKQHAGTLRTLDTVKSLSANGDYRGAWNVLDEKEAGRKSEELRAAREDVAMEWLRNIRASDGETFTKIVQNIQPVLVHGMEVSHGARKADLAAHMGWLWFLRWRDGARDVEPATYYRQALAENPGNPFANAMLGHWVLWNGRSEKLDEARRYFTAALASGRERVYVRQMQLAALRNINRNSSWQEYLRVLNDMRKNGESIGHGDALPLVGELWFTLRDEKRKAAYVSAVPPEEQAATVQALSASLTDLPAYKRDLLDVWSGLLEEEAGRRDQALEIFRSVQTRKSNDGRVAEAADAGVKRLAR